jgi:DNA-binding transcriptional ArsR family regulator
MIIKTIISKLQEGPKSINQIAGKDLNWRTADKYLKQLEELNIVTKRKLGNSIIYYLYDKDTFFKIPLSKEKKLLVEDIYAKIKKHSKNLTKTQAHKILFELNQKFNLNIPIGWYLYGPICLQQFNGNEKEYNLLNNIQIKFLKETTQEYSSIDNFELEDKIYKKTNNKLYLLKKSLQKKSENVNLEMMDLIMLSPDETKELVTDYARAVMLLGWNFKTKELFNLIWKYIATVNFKNDLKEYFNYDLDIYFKNKIEEYKSEAEKILDDLVIHFADKKYSQEPLYQKFVKHKK